MLFILAKLLDEISSGPVLEPVSKPILEPVSKPVHGKLGWFCFKLGSSTLPLFESNLAHLPTDKLQDMIHPEDTYLSRA